MNNNRHKAFIREYLKDQNGKQAAIRAGYSKRSAEVQASQLLRNPKVKAVILEKMKSLEEKVLVTKEYVVRGFKTVAERCLQIEPVMEFDHDERKMVQAMAQIEDEETGEFKLVGIYKFDASGANKALECLGKHLGIFIEKHEHTGRNGGPIRLEDLVSGSYSDESIKKEGNE